MTARFAVVVLLPETVVSRLDFVSREFGTVGEITAALEELEEKCPKWRVISFCHIEDLPALMEEPK